MRKILCLSLFLLPFGAFSQDAEVLRAARYLSGALDDEEVDEYWVCRLEARQGRPIRLNSSPVRADGLLSDYQLASLEDYRARSGDVLSLEELALVDGFSREFTEAMGPFLSLESFRAPGSRDTARVRGSAIVRATPTAIGGKARVTGRGWRAGGTWRGSGGTFHAEGTFRRHRLVAGDYNLRFGQGLALWTGFSLSSLSTPDAFLRRPGGLSPAWSYSSASLLRGAAYEYTAPHGRFIAFAGWNSLLGVHADYLGRHVQAGASLVWHYAPGGKQFSLSLDGRWNHRGADLAWELALQRGAPGGTLSLRKKLGPCKIAFQGRALPSRFSGKKHGEYAIAGGFGYDARGSFTLDVALLPIPGERPVRFQIRTYASCLFRHRENWTTELRFTGRYRNYDRPRSSLRADTRITPGIWSVTARAELVHSEKIGLLGYLEGGCKSEPWMVYLRLTGFRSESWNDRIYCYERDAPGNFLVPAYSGKGGSVSLYGGWKKRLGKFTLKTYLRGACTLRTDRKAAVSAALQLQCER